MSCHCDIPPLPNARDELRRIARATAQKINTVGSLTDRERGLLMCVLAIREFSHVLRGSMDSDGHVVGSCGELVGVIPGDALWGLVNSFATEVLEGIGELDRFDPEEVEYRRWADAFLASP